MARSAPASASDLTDPAPRRLGVYSLGFLWQPRLRRALAACGWRVTPGVGRVDAIGVWGRRGVARRGLIAARALAKPVLTLEDGFLRSITPGPRQPIVSLILDDLGVYYDATQPSRLEALIAAEPAISAAEADTAMARLRALRLSKYNSGPDLADPPKGHVLVVDQTAGDASIRWGGAGPESFRAMLAAARAEHPGAEILVKTHPETAAGRKPGHFTAKDLGPGMRLFSDPVNPWDLIQSAASVYTVSSQLGMEALIAGRPVRVFGQPFYAGWGATMDECGPIDRRRARRSAREIFAAAYLAYPTYFDPWRGERADFATALEALAQFRSAARAPATVAVGVRLWKRRPVAAFLSGASGKPIFEDDPARAADLARGRGRRLAVWAPKCGDALAQAAAGAPITRIEDGFLRSNGLGAALTPPLSVALDDTGIYYDPTQPSRLERLIAAATADPAAAARGEALIAQIRAAGVTKYNLDAPPPPSPPKGARVILAPGQVADDASIRLGAGAVRSDLDLLRAIREAAPEAHLIYKPHPDVVAGLRPGGAEGAEALADRIELAANPAHLIDQADEVWTITSLMGFEALIRGKQVTTLGAPFYAGWGLTADLGAPPARREARPSLGALAYAALIAYPLYRDPVSGLPCPAEVIVDRLAAGRGGRRSLGLKTLAKLQGRFAGQSRFWR